MIRQLAIEPTARRDLRLLAGYIAERVSMNSAQRWRTRIGAALGKLPEQAERWPLSEDPSCVGTGMREANMGRRPHIYRILYTFDAERVIIHRIRHAAQDYLDRDDS